MNCDISFIIVNYRSEQLVINAIKSILKFVLNLSYEIIIVDNEIEKSKRLKEFALNKLIHYMPMPENIGFGKANNEALKISNGESLFLLNADAYLIDRDSVKEMHTYLKSHAKIACVGTNLVTAELKPNISYGNFYSVKRALCDMGLYYPGKEYFDKHLATSKICDCSQPTDVDYLTAAAVMIKRSVIEEVGFFDPDYFLYYEDMDLCYRFKKAGYRNVILPHLNIVHIGGQSALATDNNNRMIYKEIERSKYLFLKKTSGTWIAEFVRLLMKIHAQYLRVRYFLKSRFKKSKIGVANT